LHKYPQDGRGYYGFHSLFCRSNPGTSGARVTAGLETFTLESQEEERLEQKGIWHASSVSSS